MLLRFKVDLTDRRLNAHLGRNVILQTRDIKIPAKENDDTQEIAEQLFSAPDGVWGKMTVSSVRFIGTEEEGIT